MPTGKVPTRKLGQTDWQAEELRVLEADLGEDEIRQLKEADVGNILEVWRILGDSTRLKRKHSESGSGEVPEEVAEGREPGKELEELGEEEEEEQQEEEEEGEQESDPEANLERWRIHRSAEQDDGTPEAETDGPQMEKDEESFLDLKQCMRAMRSRSPLRDTAEGVNGNLKAVSNFGGNRIRWLDCCLWITRMGWELPVLEISHSGFARDRSISPRRASANGSTDPGFDDLRTSYSG